MVRMDESVSENRIQTFNLKSCVCIYIYKLLVANGAPAGFLFSRDKHAPGFPEHALSGFRHFSSIVGSQGVPMGPDDPKIMVFESGWSNLGSETTNMVRISPGIQCNASRRLPPPTTKKNGQQNLRSAAGEALRADYAGYNPQFWILGFPGLGIVPLQRRIAILCVGRGDW